MWVSAIYSLNDVLIVKNSTFINNVGNFGGAVYSANASVFTDCIFINNSAKGGGYGYNFGGAIRVQNGAINVTRCIFYGNNASAGSAIELFSNLVKEVNINYNIFDNFPENVTVIDQSNVKVPINANYNYFGTNSNPSNLIGINITADYWTILNITPQKDRILVGDEVDLNVDFTKYTDGENISSLSQSMPNMDIRFNPSLGEVKPDEISIENGIASVKYIAVNDGDESIIAYVPISTYYIEFIVNDLESNTIYVSTNGSDENGDGTKDNPYKTIAKAITANEDLGGSRTIYVFNGNYILNSQDIKHITTIIGETNNGVIINGESNDYILNSSSNLKITNLTFINAKTAIINNGNLSISNSNFTSNNQGGIISNEGNVIITDSVFVNNTNINGGAINGKDTNFVINNTLFDSNSADAYGGSIYLFNSSIELNYNDVSNSTSKLNGNYIYLNSSKIINPYINFMDNSSYKFEFNKSTPILNATVTDNSGNPISGGEISFYLNNDFFINVPLLNGVASYNFDNTKIGFYFVSGNYSNSLNPIINTGNFEIYKSYWFIGDKGYKTLQDAIADVEDNQIIKGLEGVYYYNDSVIIESEYTKDITTFTITSLNGGELIFDGSNVSNKPILSIEDSDYNITLKGLTFRNAFNEGDGGAIYNHGYLYINNCTFYNNKVIDPLSGTYIDYNRGGAIFNYGGYLIIRNSTFTNNTAPLGGAIFTGADVANRSFTDIENCKFIVNNGSSYNDAGGAIYLYYTQLYVKNSLFENNTALSLNNYSFYKGSGGGTGAAIYLRTTSVASITNCDFISNHALYWGGAIKTYNNVSNISDCRFINNSAQSGGALHGYFGLINNCTFINNTGVKGEGINSNTIRGGAIDSEGKSNIYNSTFIGNTANEGGAIFTGFGNAIIDGCYFENNTGVNGGALQNYHNVVNVTNSTFLNNQATTGGAIYHSLSYYGSASQFYVGNCSFLNNDGTIGGALYLSGNTYKGSNIVLDSNRFINNTANENGAAIYSNSSFIANYNVFIDNQCLVNGSYSNISSIYKNDTNQTNMSLDYNWWGNNTPNWNNLLVNVNAPDIYLVFNLTYENITNVNDTKMIIGNLYWNGTNNKDNVSKVPIRFIRLDTSLDPNEGSLGKNNGTLENGYFSTTLTALAGEYLVVGKVDYEVQTIQVVIKGLRTTYVIIDTPINGSTNSTLINTKLSDYYNNPIKNKNIELIIFSSNNGSQMTYNIVTDENGESLFDINNLDFGNYFIIANFAGDDRYSSSINSTTFNISHPYSSSIIISVDENKTVVISLIDNENNPITNAELKYSINGTSVGTLITDENGLAYINNLNGEFRIFVNYEGNETFSGSNASSLIVIKKKLDTSITCSNMTQTAVDFYHGERGGYFTAILK
ncbi:hypothetical protein BGI41_05900, partial [Methanobrevibacter sp. 87.7]|uniref:hypothetical protein n=1 Tax=Methanobrevibacter sp. 87.7 TaxID=387957 RepID=UPI000B696865